MCSNENHEHLTEFDHDGEPLAAPAPMTCSHCKRPAHYDTETDQYEHDDDYSCFLMGPSKSAC